MVGGERNFGGTMCIQVRGFIYNSVFIHLQKNNIYASSIFRAGL